MFKNVLLGLAVCLTTCAATSAQEEKFKEMKGAIRGLDIQVGTITLHPQYTEKLQTFSLASKDLPIVDALGNPIKLTDLREELRVIAKVRNDSDVVGLRVEMPSINGMIKSTDAASRSVSLKSVYMDRTFRLPASVKILASGQEVMFDQLKVGGAIQVLFALDGKTIVQVHTGKGVNIRDPGLRILRHYGIVSEVNHTRRTVQIFEQSPDIGMLRTYPISHDVFVQTMYHLKPVSEVNFDQFAKLLKVYYTIDRDTGRIITIDADLPVMARRKVLKVDAETRRLTIEDEREEKTLELAADVKVWTPKGDGKLADIAVNSIVNCAFAMDRSKVQLVYVWDR